ncbi:MAG: hypothetical protein FH748_02385 [Balneolaceae bacterium]|nr:hypothetical protein [Balneolaceae bacterium]
MAFSTADEFSNNTKNTEVFKIFGKNVQVVCRDTELAGLLFRELSAYPQGENKENVLRIEILEEQDFDQQAGVFPEENRIHADNRLARLCFVFDENQLARILYAVRKPVNRIHGWLQRWRSLGYNNRQERIGQMFHEQVLVPGLVFQVGVYPIHSSAIKMGDEVILFGGYGGVGKTSLELEFCYEGGASFVADDICVLSAKGTVFPNLNYPKLYAYNVNGKPEIEQRLLGNVSAANRMHWKYQSMKGLAKVRRRISPGELYEHFERKELPVSWYLILKRDEGSSIVTETLSAEEAAAETVKILESEFKLFFERLKKTNISSDSPFHPAQITGRWREGLEKAFTRLDCRRISIPGDMPHEEFKSKMKEVFKQRIKRDAEV